MRSMLLLLFALSPLSYADEQYSEYHCNELKKEKQRIQERFTKGYGVAEGNYLNDRDRELFQIMRKHCVRPTTPDEPSASIGFSDEPEKHRPVNGAPYNPRAINENWSAMNKTYVGEKREAWDSFYKIPAKCRQVSMSGDDFIFCSEDKLEQRKQFEVYWRNRIKIN